MSEFPDPSEAELARDQWLEQALVDSFPASDPVAAGRRPEPDDDA